MFCKIQVKKIIQILEIWIGDVLQSEGTLSFSDTFFHNIRVPNKPVSQP